MKKWLLWLVALAALGGLQAVLRGWIGAYNYQIVVLVGVNIILAVSLNLINGITGQFSIGHAGFYAIGAYTSASLVYYGQTAIRSLTEFLPAIGQNVVLLIIGVLGAAVAAAIAGLAVGIPSLRLRGDYLAIVTLGFGEIIRVVILNVDAIGGARGFSGIPQLSNFFWVYLFVILTVITVLNFVHSSFDRALRSIRADEIAAEAMGVDTTKYKVKAFVIGSFLAGVAGALYAHYTPAYLNPTMFTFIRS